MALNIIKYYLTRNRCYQSAQKRTAIGIQIHTIGCAQGTAQAVADYWNQSAISACVTYICDADIAGKVLQCLPEDYYTWADAGYGNRNLITIEVAESDFMKYSGSGASYKVTNNDKFIADIKRGYNTAVLLCADICKRHGWNPWTKLPSGLYLISSHDEGRIAGLSSAHVDPSHLWPKISKSMDSFRADVVAAMNGTVPEVETEIKWFRVRKSWTDVSSQLGAYESEKNAKDHCPFGYSVYDSTGKTVYTNDTVPVGGTQIAEFAGLSESVAANKALEMIHVSDTSGILWSVTTAQWILESGYGTTNLAKLSNNCFGMKTTLSNNTWPSVWDGVSSVTVPTQECYDGHTYVTINAAFRKYPDVQTSIRDHSAYLLGAKNGDKLRYAGLTSAKNYREAITIIKNGGYATDPKYIDKICNIIMRFGLDKYDGELLSGQVTPTPAPTPENPNPTPVVLKHKVYRVQLGLFENRQRANNLALTVNKRTGYSTSIEMYNNQYQPICGSFTSEANAKARVNTLRSKFGIVSLVKEIEIS